MTEYPNPNLLVDTAWLSARLNDSNLRLLDARVTDPRLPFGYKMGHLPGAQPLDPGREFFAVLNGTRDLAPLDRIAQSLGARGIARDSTVVIYDEWTGTLAAYTYWALKHIGHADARILHGGWAAWKQSGGAVSAEVPKFAPTAYELAANPHVRATADWIQRNSARADVFLLDARNEGEYDGGHIPGAVNLSYETSIDPATQMFKDAAVLRAQLETVGATSDKEIVAYCASGARSALTFTALQLLGYPRVRNYDGSMMDWLQARGLPVE